MRLTDLTPEEREVYRVAFAVSIAPEYSFEALELAKRQATRAVLGWRELLASEFREPVGPADSTGNTF